MASSVIGALRVNLGLDSAQFIKGTKNAQTAAQSMSLKMAAVGAAIGAALGTAAAAFIKLSQDAINTADEISKAALSIGIGTEELSRLRYAADLSGVSFEQLQTGVGRLSRNMLDASRGIGTGKRAFEQLGIAVTNSDGTLRSATDVIGDVADRFAGMKDGAEKTALAMEIFGRAGASLIPMLNGGRDGLRELTEEADRFGVVISAETGRQAELFNDNLTRLQGAFSALATRIAADALPHLIRFTEWLLRNQEEIVQAVSRFGDFINGVVRMGSAVASGVAWMQERFGVLFRAISMILNPMGRLVDLTIRLGGGGGGGSGGPLGQTASAMMGMANQAIAMSRAMGGVETQSTGAAKAVRSVGSAASVAKDEFQDLMEALYPENISRRQREQLSAIEKFRDRIANPDGARLRALGVGGDAPVSRDLINQGVTDGAKAVMSSNDLIGKSLEELQGKAERTTVRVADTFAQMSQRITSSLNGLANSIRSGDFLGILSGVLDIFTTLGSAGVFGKGLAGKLNTPSFAGGGFTGMGARAGGLDGKGGFLAMLHPRETVIDHTRGGSAPMNITVTPSPYFDVRVDGRIVQAAPAVANAGAMQAQAMGARSARRRVRG